MTDPARTQYWIEPEVSWEDMQLNKRIARRERNGQILLRYLDGITQREIAREFKLTQGRISQILKVLKGQQS